MLLNPRKPKSQARQEHEDGRYLTYRPSTSPHLKYPYVDCPPSHSPSDLIFLFGKEEGFSLSRSIPAAASSFVIVIISSHALEPSVSQSSSSNPFIYRYGYCTSSGSWSSDSEQSIPRARHSHPLLGQSPRPERCCYYPRHDTTLPAYSRFSTNYP